jgi:hypothetical protein
MMTHFLHNPASDEPDRSGPTHIATGVSQLGEPRPWRRVARDITSGIMVGLVAGVVIFLAQLWVDNSRQDMATRLENLRFVRMLSSASDQERPFAGLDLAGMNLSGLNLSGADFRGADLSNAQLNGTFLEGADFAYANLNGANFQTADLVGAQLSQVRIGNTNFASASLRGALIEPRSQQPSANFNAADFAGGIVSGVDFSGTPYLNPVGFIGATFQDVDLSHPKITYSEKDSKEITVYYCVPSYKPNVVNPHDPRVKPRGTYDDCLTLRQDLLKIEDRSAYVVPSEPAERAEVSPGVWGRLTGPLAKSG